MNTDLRQATSEFCPVLTELLRTRRAVGRTGRVYNGLAALSTVNNLQTIRCLMHELRPLRTLEIGLSFGGSALVFCASHKELCRPPEGQHTALDPHQATVWDSCGLMAVERAGLMSYLDFRAAYSAFELPRLVEQGAQIDLVYVDGSHLFEDVFVDAYYVARLLAPGGWFYSMTVRIRTLRRSCDFCTRTSAEDWRSSILVLQRGSKTASNTASLGWLGGYS